MVGSAVLAAYAESDVMRNFAIAAAQRDASLALVKDPGPGPVTSLALLIDEINHTPPAIPDDNRPITYRITPKPGI